MNCVYITSKKKNKIANGREKILVFEREKQIEIVLKDRKVNSDEQEH